MTTEGRTWTAVVVHGRPSLDDESGYRHWFRETFGEGEELAITVAPREQVRSLSQNAAFHAALTRWVREALPEYQVPTVAEGVERLKDELLGLCFGFHVYQSRLTGEIVRALHRPHTSKLTRSQFAELFDLTFEEAAKTGYVMETPEEFMTRRLEEGA